MSTECLQIEESLAKRNRTKTFLQVTGLVNPVCCPCSDAITNMTWMTQAHVFLHMRLSLSLTRPPPDLDLGRHIHGRVVDSNIKVRR